MSDDYASSGASIAGALIFFFVYLIIVAGVYVWSSLATSRVFRKLGVAEWKAWVPVVNTIEIFSLGGASPVWVVALFFPIVQIAGLVVFYFAIHSINRRFRFGVGYTILAIFLYPVWATIVGFGSATALPPGAPTPDYARAPAHPSYPPVPPVPPLAPAFSAPPPPPPSLPPAPAAAAPPPPPPAPVPPLEPPSPPKPATPPPAPPAPVATPSPTAPGNPWAPPIDSVPGLVAPAAPPPVSAVVTPVPVVPPAVLHPESAPAAPEADDDLDKTVIASRRRAPVFVLTPAGGEPIRLTATDVVLGRNPASTEPGVETVKVPDPSKTTSKTHARLAFDGETWTITDLDSTNGVVLIGPNGAEDEIEPRVAIRLTESFKLGRLELTLRPAE